MRQLPTTLARYLVLGLVLAFATTSNVWADSRTDARTHYQAGVKAYNGGDYKVAIREFSSAQQLAPADLNNYNLALCYDKLGDPEPAIQYYRAYLDKNPNTDKRAEIEASVQRLESAAKSVAAKKADEARKAEEARKAIDARRAAEDAQAAKRAAADDEARRRAEEADAKKAPRGEPLGPTRPDIGAGALGTGTGAGSTGTPGTGTTVTTGDAQLDRVQQIDINQVRDQRVGGAASGLPDRSAGPAATAGATGAVNATGAVGANGEVATTAPNGAPRTGTAPNAAPLPGDSDKPKQVTPVYKKWWFWAVIAVSAYVVYSIASDNSSSSNTAREAHMFSIGSKAAPAQAGGLTLMRW
jgi:hypothetical protein